MSIRWVAGAVGIGMALLAAPPAGAAISDLTSELQKVSALGQQNDCARALPLIGRMTADADFPRLSDEVRVAVWTLGAACAAEGRDIETAFTDAREATNVPGAPDVLWEWRIEFAIVLNHAEDVAEAAERATAERPTALGAVDEKYFGQFTVAETTADDARPLVRLVAALDKANFTPPPGVNMDRMRTISAQYLIDHGDAAGAAAEVAPITDIGELLRVKLDGRFAAVVAASPARFDLKAAAERQLDFDRGQVAAHPDSLSAVVATSRALRALERPGEALTLVRAALARTGHGAKSGFADESRELNWVQNEEADALLEVGQTQEALEAMKVGAKIQEDGMPLNVSQTLNYASELVTVDRAPEALQLLGKFNADRDASGYGRGVYHQTAACADAQLGRASDLARELAYLTAHQADDPGARTFGLLCANDLDGVAADMIARLADPRQREAALITLSDFDEPKPIGRWDELMRQRFEQVAARADVQAAIAKVGHVEHVPLDGKVFPSGF